MPMTIRTTAQGLDPGTHGITRRRMLVCAGVVLLEGCSSIPYPVIRWKKATKIFVLSPEAPPPRGAAVNWRLSVDAPTTRAGLDTTRIALSHSTTTMEYFESAIWDDRLPTVVQRFLIQTFDDSGRIVAVDRDAAGPENDYQLQTEIREFEARYDGPDIPPRILVGIQAKIARMPGGEIVDSLNTMHTTRAAADNIDSIIVAFNQAAGAAISQIAAWTLAAPSPEALSTLPARLSATR